MKGIKKWFMICLVFGIFFSNTKIVQAYDIKTNIAMEVLDLYANFSFMEWRVAIMDILDVGYSDFEYTINNIEIESKVDTKRKKHLIQ